MARRFIIKTEISPAGGEYQVDYRAELNEQQHRVVTAGSGAHLVVAGAGTGKTRTLIYRLAWLVESGVPPEQIVLLTFTRRASREMLTRASELLDGRCRRVQGGTFHAFCLSILKRHAERLGYPNQFTVLDASDAADAIDVLRGRVRPGKTGRRFPRKRRIQRMFSSVRNQGIPLTELLETRYPQFISFSEPLQDLFSIFQTYKKSHGLMDYDDLLLQTRTLFDEHDDVLQRVAGRCRHVLVDEYQDTNRAQAGLVSAFASVHGNVMVVGDDAQSIYRFRGADLKNILSFPETFEDVCIQKLEHNYRSTQSILDLANRIIASARHTFDKRLFTVRGAGDLPVLISAADERYESRFVAQMVLEMRETGIGLHEMAVLFRSGFNSFDLEMELNRRSIPFVKYGGLKLSEAAHIKDLVAHLKALENPGDTIAWNRILQLIEGIGPRTAAGLISWIEEAGRSAYNVDESRHSPRYIESLKNLFEVLRGLLDSKAPLTTQLELLVQYYEPILRRIYYEDYPKRLQDLEQFVGLAEHFPDRAGLLASVALEPIELTAIDVEMEEDDELPLVLSTIHSAKGLEFKVVFLIQVLDGVLPSSYAVGDPEAEDEELRLLYVAVTRAADQLFITWPQLRYRSHDGRYFTIPCRFLKEIPPEILEQGTIVEEDTGLLPENGSETDDEVSGLLMSSPHES